jgi:ParB-like chromosome segregation protein Spo0J
VPVLIDAKRKVIAGHGRIMACKLLGWSEVPTIALEHLSEAQARKLMRYIRHYNRAPKPIKWTYRDPNHRISVDTTSSVTGH